jgi:nicotinamidase-related amidase
MKPASTRKTALIIIDVQNGFLHPTYWGTSRSTPRCEENIERLLKAARTYNSNIPADSAHSILITHVLHHSTSLESQLHPSKQIESGGQTLRNIDPLECAKPLAGEPIWTKNVNSAFIGTGLEALLRENGVRQLVICGLTTDHCVSTSTRMAANLRIVDVMGEDGQVVDGGEIVLVGDACATHARGKFDAETVHQVSLASLDGEFAEVHGADLVIEKVLAA